MFTVDVVKIVGLSLLRHSVRNVSFQRFLVGIAAILLLLPTACFRQDDAQAPVVDNLGTVFSPSNSLIREPTNSSATGTLKSTMSTSGSSTVTIYPTTMATLMIIWSRLCARIW